MPPSTEPAPAANSAIHLAAAGAAAIGKHRMRGRWAMAVGALLVALLAVAVSSRGFTSSSRGRDYGCPGTRNYTGMGEDCCCDYETVDAINKEVLHPILQELATLPFFRYFKCDCPFWPDDGMCLLRDCSVCECPDNEFPEPFKKPYSGLSSDSMICQEGKPQATVDRTLDTKVFKGWVEIDNPWTYDDETDNAEMTYVNLLLNPERYTGYTGDSARRIWDSIYKENCPKYPSEEMCQEKKALYKLISGLHSSISVHIAYDYLLDESANMWGHNLPFLYDRVLKYPERVQNLYFTYLFVLRAVTKTADYLEQAEYNTGSPEEDLKTQSLVKQLLYTPKIRSACLLPFNEAKLWQGENGTELSRRFRSNLEISVQLWIVLDVRSVDYGESSKFLVSLQLQRNEVIALVNLLNRLSESVNFVHEKGPSIDKPKDSQRLPH
uniref:Uncharacterized protein n=1 Tax=Leersia perrieri TaxID=77586 RepID=A0A0D9WHB3_9ORYZ